MHISILAPMCRVSIYPIIIFTMRLTPTIVQAEAVVCRKSRASERAGERERAQQRNTTNNSSDGDDGHHNNNNYNYNSSIKPTLLCVRACVCRTELILNLLRSLFHQQEDEQHDSTARDWWLNESNREQGRARESESGREQESNANTLPRPNHVYHYIYGPWGLPTPITHCDFPQVFFFGNCIQLYRVLL